MEIGNQIKNLRLRRGITQEMLAQHLGVTAQAVSKWERDAATPDIALLPDLSSYFGVTIDELFALSDDTRMERIQNMLWDIRYLNSAEVETERRFLLEKARREPENGKPHAMLAALENHIAKGHHDMAAEYAKEAIKRNHTLKQAHSNLVEAMRGLCGDWNTCNHHDLIEYYKDFVAEHPDNVSGYLWLLEQLVDSNRLREAQQYCDQLAKIDHSFRTPFYRGLIALTAGHKEAAQQQFDYMQQNFGDDWCTWMSMGDIYARTGDFENAEACYRKYLDLQQAPRYTDGLTAIAQMREARGDYAGAIDAVKEEIELIKNEWDTTTGETIDQHLRNIARLKEKMK